MPRRAAQLPISIMDSLLARIILKLQNSYPAGCTCYYVQENVLHRPTGLLLCRA